MTRDLPAAAAPESRLSSLDALRGLALLGVLLSNLHYGFRINYYAEVVESELWADILAEAFVWLFINGKAFALFSLLFGAGLAMQAERLSRQGAPTMRILYRRLAVLLVFGLIHFFLIWNGDILTEYAVIGMVVIPLLFIPARQAALIGLLSLAAFVSMSDWISDYGPLDIDPAVARAAIAQGSYFDRLRFEWTQEAQSVFGWHVYTAARTFGLMMLGAFAWKMRAALAERLLAVRVAAAWLMAVGVALTIEGDTNPYAYTLGPPVMAVGYAAAFLSFTGRGLARLAAPVGRMAFTNYLTQSVVLGFLFFGHGLALQDRVGPGAGLAIGITLWLAQAGFSAWWLKSHRFGPMEWLWRRATYGRGP